ncbi:MAG: low molecular weight phosphatase family protein [Candidatus Nanohaloarchaea archaeon]
MAIERVLYICTGNSFRSPAAEALTRKYYPDLELESAGTEATDHIAKNMKRLLTEEGAIQYVKPQPDQVSERAVNQADRIVCMMPEHREFLMENFDVEEEKIQVWNIEDPIRPHVSVSEAFEQIENEVKNLF